MVELQYTQGSKTVDAPAEEGDAIREYVRDLRSISGKSQESLALDIGMPLGTYKFWEQGRTKKIDTIFIVRMFVCLKAPLDHLIPLVMNQSVPREDIERLVRAAEQHPRHYVDDIDEIIRTTRSDHLTQILAEMERQPEMWTRLLDWVSGWRARR